MKILVLTQTYHPSIGGGIRYKKAVTEHLRSRGHQVDVLAVSTSAHGSVVSQDGGSVVRAPQLFRFNSTQVAPSYLGWFGSLAPEYDVLQFHFPSPMTELACLLHQRRVRKQKKIVMYHADIVPAKRFSMPYNAAVTRPFLAQMDHILVSSPNIAASSPHLATCRARVRVIPFGIEPAEFRLDGHTRPAPGGPLDVLYVGRLARYKGTEHLIRAMRDVPGRLTIVGEGPMRPACEALIAELGIEDKVRLTGTISDAELLRRYHDADVLVLPSTDAGEAFGYVLVEAMVCKTAIISTELGTGTSFVNADRETGYVVPPGDPDAIRGALLDLDGDRAKLARFQAAAERRVLEHFTLERMLAETVSVFEG